MENQSCVTCQKPKATLICGSCQNAVCKYCARFTDEESFAFMAQWPVALQHDTYCHGCFEEKAAPVLSQYARAMDQAKNVRVYLKKQGKETRTIKRELPTLVVKDCRDHDETILRLAFLAVEQGFNTLVDVELSWVKVKEGSYSHVKWSGSAVPARTEFDRVILDRSLWQSPN